MLSLYYSVTLYRKEMVILGTEYAGEMKASPVPIRTSDVLILTIPIRILPSIERSLLSHGALSLYVICATCDLLQYRQRY